MPRVPIAVVSLALALLTAVPRLAFAQTGGALCSIRTTERVVAVGDVHGAYDQFVAILRETGLIDNRQRWTGGRALLIQTGDVLDRGADSRRVVDLLQKLEREASRAGGRVYALLGNHELMRVVGDWRYVSDGEYKAFTRSDSEDVREAVLQRVLTAAADRAAVQKQSFDSAAFREQFIKDVPLGFIEMRVAFEAAGAYGRWVRSRPTMVKVNDIAFLHGGISEEVAARGCEGVNETMQKELAALPTDPERIMALLGSGETGPLWYRGLASEPEETFEPTLRTILERMGARGFVIGHTPVPGAMVTRFGGRVVQIDAGMLNGTFFPKGVPSALELRGTSLTAVYLGGRRTELPAPQLFPSATAPAGSTRP